MNSYVENWFDSEIAGKSQYSMITEAFVNEYNDFKRMLDAIEYCNESDVLTIVIDEGAITEKFKSMWEKFKTFIKNLFKKIKELFQKFLDKMADLKKKFDAIKNKKYEDKYEDDRLKFKTEIQTLVWNKTQYRIDINYKYFVDEFLDIINKKMDTINNITNDIIAANKDNTKETLQDKFDQLIDSLGNIKERKSPSQELNFDYTTDMYSMNFLLKVTDRINKEETDIINRVKSAISNIEDQTELFIGSIDAKRWDDDNNDNYVMFMKISREITFICRNFSGCLKLFLYNYGEGLRKLVDSMQSSGAIDPAKQKEETKYSASDEKKNSDVSKSWKPSEYLVSSIKSKNYTDIRGAIRGEIIFDEYFKTNAFDNAIQYAINNGIDPNELYQPMDDSYGKIKNDPNEWNEDYLIKARGAVELNFSKERIDNLKKASRYVYNKK